MSNEDDNPKSRFEFQQPYTGFNEEVITEERLRRMGRDDLGRNKSAPSFNLNPVIRIELEQTKQIVSRMLSGYEEDLSDAIEAEVDRLFKSGEVAETIARQARLNVSKIIDEEVTRKMQKDGLRFHVRPAIEKAAGQAMIEEALKLGAEIPREVLEEANAKIALREGVRRADAEYEAAHKTKNAAPEETGAVQHRKKPK